MAIKKLPVILLAVIGTLLLIIILSVIAPSLRLKQQRPPKPPDTAPTSFLYQEVFYECSKPIIGKWIEANLGPNGSPGWYFVPERHSDLQRFCRVNAIIEYRAVIDILKRKDVDDIISKYDSTQAWVKALGHTYINDKEYLKRILPAYSDIQIDCIIVVHSPAGTRFFIENGEEHDSHDDHRYLEVSAEEFLTSLNNAPYADVNNFWLGLH